MIALAVAAGGALGAVGRYAVGHTGWAWRATLAANTVGSLLLGLFVAIEPADHWFALAGIGACGALTTMSSMALDATDQPRSGRWLLPLLHAGVGLAAATLGFALGA